MFASSTVSAPTAARPRAAGDVVRVGAVAAGAAAVANVSALVVGRAAGADMIVGEPGTAAQTVGVVPVVVTTLIGAVLGTLLLLAIRNRGRQAWTAVAIAGLVVGAATVAAPLAMSAEGATHATLAAMHVITGLSWFLVVRRGARA